MSYALGVDIGTSFITTAIARPGVGAADPPSVVDGPRFSSALFLDPDGVIRFGGTAEERGRSLPERLVRGVGDRMGDSVPVAVDETRRTPEQLWGALVRHAVERVSAGEGVRPAVTRVVVPGRWGRFRTRLADDAHSTALAAAAPSMTSPEAAVTAHRVALDPDAVVAVYDLSANRLVVSVIQLDQAGQTVLSVDGTESAGGGDVDDGILRRVVASGSDLFAEFDSSDPDAVTALRDLRLDCIRAKEALAGTTTTSIAIRLPTGQADVTLDRAALDRIAEPVVRSTLAVFRRAMRDAGIDAGRLDGIILAGGSARLAAVSRVLDGEFARPILSSASPERTAARGAAISAAVTMGASVPVLAGASAVPAIDPAPAIGWIGSRALRRGTGAVAAAMAAIAGSATVGGEPMGESDSAGSVG